MLSKSVADGLSYYGDPDTKATEKFCHVTDCFFDCLNVRCMDAWKKKKKNDLKPYADPDDKRLKVMDAYHMKSNFSYVCLHQEFIMV